MITRPPFSLRRSFPYPVLSVSFEDNVRLILTTVVLWLVCIVSPFPVRRARVADLGWLPRSYNALAGVDVKQPLHLSSPRQRSPSHRGKRRKQGLMSSSPPQPSSVGAATADTRGRHALPYQQSLHDSFLRRRVVAGRGRAGRGEDGGESWSAGGTLIICRGHILRGCRKVCNGRRAVMKSKCVVYWGFNVL